MLGAGCVLLGDIEIGDGAVIGANAVVGDQVGARRVRGRRRAGEDKGNEMRKASRLG